MKHFSRRLISTTLAISLAVPPQLFMASARAEDIDIFVGTNANATAARPNVLFILDNSANWNAQAQHWTDGSAQGEAEIKALREVVGGLTDNINIGLMMFAPGSGGANEDGGYVRFAVRQMTSANKQALQEQLGVDGCVYNTTTNLNSLTGSPNCMLAGFSVPQSTGGEMTATADTEYSAALFEAFKYFGGFTSPANASTDTAGSPVVTTVPSTNFGPYRYAGDPDSKTDPNAFFVPFTQYRPPVSADNNCAKNFIIFIGNGFPTQDAPASLLTGVGGNATQQPMPQVVTSTSTTTTGLGPRPAGTCESRATCAAAAQAQFGTDYDSYTCIGGTQNTPATFTDTVCRTPAQCATQAAIDHPGYASYTCSGGTTNPPSCTGQNRINQTITATPAGACSGTNFMDQTMQGTKQVISVTFPDGAPSTLPTGSEPRWADEWARFLQTTDINGSPTDDLGPGNGFPAQLGAPGQQNITIFTIDVFKDNQDARQTRLLYNMAKLGGGEYYQASSYQAIYDAIQDALRKIQAKSSVFAAASLPVSATNRAQNENQVFFGLFRPDANADPRWYGNLKRYQIARSGPDFILADSIGANAIESVTTGFFDACAVSYWTTNTTASYNPSGTPPTDSSYWTFSSGSARVATQTCIAYPFATYSPFSDLPDGGTVEKGGAAEVLRRGNNPASMTFTYGSTQRNMYTCADTNCASGMEVFNTTNVSAAALGVPGNASEQTRIVNFTRGQDVGNVAGNPLGDENVSGSTADIRPSVHGDVVHSRPLPVNYGGTTGVVVYYGSNDGALRALRSGRGTTAAAVNADDGGKELWSFIAPEHHGQLKRLTENSPVIKFPNVLDLTAQPKGYFFDGTMGLLQQFNTTTNVSTKAWLFASMRRGGRSVYAFDVTDPISPALKWRAGCSSTSLSDSSDCTTGLSDIGQTWSTPSVAFIKDYPAAWAPGIDLNTATVDPVVVMGGGYDSCDDADTALPTCSSAKGRKVYVINANSGALLRAFDTDRSVASDVAMVDRNFDGAVDHAYAVDTGGNIYRIDFVDPTTLASLPVASWAMNKIATVANNSGRKFLFPPAVLSLADRVILTIGSGDREHPLYTNYPYTTPVTNRFYAFTDLMTLPATVLNLDTSTDMQDTTISAPATTCLPESRGWRMSLAGGDREQVVTSSLIAGGKVFFNTNKATAPAVGVCTNDLGEARGYNIDVFCGGGFAVNYLGGGLPISPVLGQVELADGSVVTVVIGGPGDPTTTNPFTPFRPPVAIAPLRSRLYWYRPGDK